MNCLSQAPLPMSGNETRYNGPSCQNKPLDRRRERCEKRKESLSMSRRHESITQIRPRPAKTLQTLMRSEPAERMPHVLSLAPKWTQTQTQSTADGRPCLDTKHLLAALGIDMPEMQLAPSASKRKSTISQLNNCASKASRRDHARQAETKATSMTSHAGNAPRGSTDSTNPRRPRLSKDDRPHWAQQSQAGEDMQYMKEMLKLSRYQKLHFRSAARS